MIRRALEQLVSEHLGEPVVLAGEPRSVSGGFWASIYAFELNTSDRLPPEWSGRLILRVMPDRRRALHEIIVHREVAQSGFPTPRVLHDGFDDEIGGAYMIMPFANGRPPLAGLGIGSLVSLPRVLRQLPVQLADVAVRLHAVDPAPIGAALQRAGVGGRGDGAASRLAAIDAAAKTESSGFLELLGWFVARRPHEPPLVICHGDLHPFNLLVDDHGDTVVLDWTNGDLMPREFEVGSTAGFLRCAPISVPRIVAPALGRLTRWLAGRFVRAYARSAPLDPALLDWFEALQYARCLAEVATARCGLTTIVHAEHPFEISARAMTARLAEITGITVTLPTRLHVPAS